MNEITESSDLLVKCFLLNNMLKFLFILYLFTNLIINNENNAF